jgi:hypothetical protein
VSAMGDYALWLSERDMCDTGAMRSKYLAERDMSHRPLYVIAGEIRATWPKPYFGAVPYISAMSSLTRMTDAYGMDSADSIVRYFLVNAKTWRGDDARRIKAELKAML